MAGIHILRSQDQQILKHSELRNPIHNSSMCQINRLCSPRISLLRSRNPQQQRSLRNDAIPIRTTNCRNDENREMGIRFIPRLHRKTSTNLLSRSQHKNATLKHFLQLPSESISKRRRDNFRMSTIPQFKIKNTYSWPSHLTALKMKIRTMSLRHPRHNIKTPIKTGTESFMAGDHSQRDFTNPCEVRPIFPSGLSQM